MARTFQIVKIMLSTMLACLLVLLLGSASWASTATPGKGGGEASSSVAPEGPGADDSQQPYDDPCNGYDLYLEIFTSSEGTYLVFQGECVRDSSGRVVEIQQSYDINATYQVTRRFDQPRKGPFRWSDYRRSFKTTTTVSWKAKTHELTAPTVRYHSPVRKGGASNNRVVAVAAGFRPASMTIRVYGTHG